MGILADVSTAVVEMTVHGSWSQQLGRQVAASIRLCLAGPSASVIIDLQDLEDPYGISLPFWLSVAYICTVMFDTVTLSARPSNALEVTDVSTVWPAGLSPTVIVAAV